MARYQLKSISLRELLTNLPAFSEIVSMASSQVPNKKIKTFVMDHYDRKVYNSTIQLLRFKIIVSEKLRIKLVPLIKGNYQRTPLKMKYISPLEALLDCISFIDLKIKLGSVNNSELRVLIQLLNIYKHNGKMKLS